MSSSSDRSFTNILEDIVGNVEGIIRSEVRLAKAELQEETIKAGKAARLAGVGAGMALYAAGFVLLAFLYALETAVTPWLAALIVAVVVGVVAAGLINLGVKRMKRIDPRPDKTVHTIKENLEWAKNQTR